VVDVASLLDGSERDCGSIIAPQLSARDGLHVRHCEWDNIEFSGQGVSLAVPEGLLRIFPNDQGD